MADDASVEQFTINRFYCHQCLAEISRVLPDYKCPTCQSGFIEALEAPPEVEDDSESEMNDVSQPYDVLMRALMGLPHRRSGRHGRNQPMAPIDTLIQDFVVNVTGRAGWSGHSVGVRSNGPVPAASPNTTAPGSPASPILSFHWSTNLGQDAFPPSSSHGHIPTLPAFLLNLMRNLDINTNDLPHVLQGWFLGNPGDYAWGREGLDAIVTQLLNQMDGTGPPPLAQDKIQQIPVVSITDDHVGVSLQCSVCWEDFKVGEPVRKLACEHVYHEPCIIPWLELHGTCPICRKTLDGDVDPNSASSSDGPLVAFLRAHHANTASDAPNRAASTSSDSSSTSSSSRSTSSRPDFNMDFD